ncbi:hypothetical protein [uncultured Desulfovibrio sp.]|uniref:hypothetical protein n=1 Tax=uncultured Desulfovibrio sp. TaxID=167968 RepID=UPI0026306F34|nr:hypothetical protein [uncultured Desulfovibrio sp.]
MNVNSSRAFPFVDRHEAAQAYSRIVGTAREHGPQAVISAMAALGRTDLFFLLTRLMNRKDADNDWCFARCKEVSAAPDGYLDLWAREHYKSTIITVALSIQDILRDPEITIGIFSHTRPNAKGFMAQIKRELESNAVLKACYPDVLYAQPEKESPVWSLDDGLLVKRQGNPKEMTVEAWGVVVGQPIGKHFRLLVYDDVVTPENVTNPEQIKKTSEQLRLSYALGAEGGARRMIGTRYHMFDTYAELLKDNVVIGREYPATVDGTADGEPRFLSRERLEEKRREFGPYNFACQMLLNPVAEDAQGFKKDWLRYWQPAEHLWRPMNRVILVDPASSKKKDSDYSVFCVVGWNVDNNLYLVHAERARRNLTERTATVFRLARQFDPLFVGYEQYGMQSDIEHIQSEMARLNYHFAIRPLGGRTAKIDRIRRLVPWFETGRFFLPVQASFTDEEGRIRNFTTEFVEEEFSSFPVCAHDDMLDCLARAVDPDISVPFPDAADGRSAVEKELDRIRQANRLLNGNAHGLRYAYDCQRGI